MDKRIPYLVIPALVVILLISSLVFQSPEAPTQQDTATFQTSSGSVEVLLEVADSIAERREGLMHRESLPEDSGMLFIFEGETVRTFWMKNTYLPLDMIFINSEKEIIHIEKDAQPCESDPCRVYSSKHPAEYVIEVNAGFSERKGLNPGDSVELNRAS